CHQGAGASIFRPTTDMPVGFGHCLEMYFVGEALGGIVEVFQRDNRVSAVGHRGPGHNGGRFTGGKCFVSLMPGRTCPGDRQGPGQLPQTGRAVGLGGHVRPASLCPACTPPPRDPTTSCPVAAERWGARIGRGPARHRVTSSRPGSGGKASSWSKGTCTVANG